MTFSLFELKISWMISSKSEAIEHHSEDLGNRITRLRVTKMIDYQSMKDISHTFLEDCIEYSRRSLSNKLGKDDNGQ